MKIFKNISIYLFSFFALSLALMSCEKLEDTRSYTPTLSFETASATVQASTGVYNLKVKLSRVSTKEIIAKVDFLGTAVLDEHYTVGSSEVEIQAGKSEVIIPITILDANIFDELLEIKVVLSPTKDYAVDPSLNPEFVLNITKEIVLPELSFVQNADNEHSNPFLAETLTFQLNLTEPLRSDSQVSLNIEGGMTIGSDFTINGGNNNILNIPKDVTSINFELKLRKRDQGGFNQNITMTLVPVENKKFIVTTEGSQFTVKVSDPIVDFTTILKSPALLGGSGYTQNQAIKSVDGEWIGKVGLNLDVNPSKKNYLRSFRNLSVISAFGCNANITGGDILRLAELLVFATTDTVIADYGAGKTSRFFSPSDSLFRFVADGENILKGTITSPAQSFTAKLVLKADWETGTNGNKQWHLDSKATNGDITQSTYPLVFDQITINLVKLEGTYNFEGTDPEMVFDAWFTSSSKHFMKNVPTSHDIIKEGNNYKISYRYTPK